VDELPLAGGCVDFARCEVRFDDGGRVELSEREGQLLRYLVRHTGRAVARQELLENVWQIDARGVSTRTVDMHVARLREKLRDDSENPRVLVTVRGRGYMLGKGKDL
jgi:DNA-binding response OmpR family regulator